MNQLLKIVTEILFRLKELPGLSFLGVYYHKVRNVHDKIKKKIRVIETQKGNLEHKIKKSKEIPTLIKGSKKKQS